MVEKKDQRENKSKGIDKELNGLLTGATLKKWSFRFLIIALVIVSIYYLFLYDPYVYSGRGFEFN